MSFTISLPKYDPEVWDRLEGVDLQFEGVRYLKISDSVHIVERKVSRWVTFNITDPDLLERVERWLKTGDLSRSGL